MGGDPQFENRCRGDEDLNDGDCGTALTCADLGGVWGGPGGNGYFSFLRLTGQCLKPTDRTVGRKARRR